MLEIPPYRGNKARNTLSATIPTADREPYRIAAGDALQWTRAVPNYPSTDWALTYVLRSGRRVYRFNANSNAGAYTVALNSNVTANWTTGVYAMGAYVTALAGGQQVQVKTTFPTLTVSANLASNPAGVDSLSFAERTLPIIEETIQKLTSRTVETAQVNGQAYTLSDIAKLWQLREKLLSEVRRERSQALLNAGLGAGNKVGIRFRLLNQQGFPANWRVPWQ